MRKVSLKQIRFALIALAVVQLVWFSYALRHTTPVEGGDTHQYLEVAAELAQHHWGVISHHERPPGYPIFLLASNGLGLKPSVAAVVFNRASAILALAILPELAAVTLGAGFLFLCSFSTIVSYENFLMCEAPMPGFLMIAWILAVLAQRLWCNRKFEAAIFLLSLQFIWLTSLKPAFKAYAVLEITILVLISVLNKSFMRKKDRPRAAANLVVLFLVMISVNAALFSKSGDFPMRWNKSVMLTQVLPRLLPEEVNALPSRAQKSYEAYQKLWKNMPKDYNGIPVTDEEGAELFDRIVKHHYFDFLKLDVIKMVKMIWYSSWNDNYGKIDMRIGIPRGFGSLGILIMTCLFGGLLAFLTRFKQLPDFGVMLELAGGAAYAFTVQMFVASNDVARISIMWLVPAFVLATQVWWLFWARARRIRA
jgi:hypothetical protein